MTTNAEEQDALGTWHVGRAYPHGVYDESDGLVIWGDYTPKGLEYARRIAQFPDLVRAAEKVLENHDVGDYVHFEDDDWEALRSVLQEIRGPGGRKREGRRMGVWAAKE